MAISKEKKLANFLCDYAKDIRSMYHMTLGKLIELLENCETKKCHILIYSDQFDEEEEIFPSQPHSYRGFFDDIAFVPSNQSITVEDFLILLKSIVDTKLKTYNQGEILIDKKAPLWISKWGQCDHIAIVDLAKYKEDMYLITRFIEG